MQRILLVEDNPGDAQLVRMVRASEDAGLRRLPVVVLSSSQAEEDVARSYERGAASHLVKPSDVDALFALVETLARYWFGAVTLPGGTATRR